MILKDLLFVEHFVEPRVYGFKEYLYQLAIGSISLGSRSVFFLLYLIKDATFSYPVFYYKHPRVLIVSLSNKELPWFGAEYSHIEVISLTCMKLTVTLSKIGCLHLYVLIQSLPKLTHSLTF